jgi:small-conductance mechanosensitive channel
VSSWLGSVTSHVVQDALAAAAGGDPQQFRQQLQALSTALAAVQQEGVTSAPLAALVQQLQATGVMLSSIAVPQFCNNPACVNISGPSEIQLVSGRSCICAGCLTARYCGRVCQQQAWRQHKPVCKALAAAAAAAGAHE